MGFEIVTDSSANLTDEMIKKHNIHIISLTVRVDGRDFKSYKNGETTDRKMFYDMMRDGKELLTSQINPADCANLFREILSRGNDVLYVCFSSTLSGTYQVAMLTAEDMAPEYPKRKILVLNSLSAALGEGMLVLRAAQMRDEGAAIDETFAHLNSIKLRVCHWFTVDDLKYLKRGGRIPAATQIVGTMLNIKPIFHMDNNGRLTTAGKVRGRRAALNELVNRLREQIEEPEKQTLYIAYADCPDDAEYLRETLSELNPADIVISILDPVIGSHTGPGTISVYFFGRER